MRQRKGFTLIELLVVVAIIAVLIAILIPSLGKAREQARKVVCQSNLKQLGVSFAMYTGEYSYYPTFRWPQAINTYISGGRLLGGPDLPEDNSSSTTNPLLAQVQPLKLIHCPSVPIDGPKGTITLTYGMNGQSGNISSGLWWAMLCNGGNGGQTDLPSNNKLPQVKVTKIYNPSQFAVLTEKWKVEGPHQSAWTTTWYRLYVSNDFACLFTHDMTTNILFADFHVDSLTYNSTTMNKNFSATLSASGYKYLVDQNDSLFNYDFGLIRYGKYTPSIYLK